MFSSATKTSPHDARAEFRFLFASDDDGKLWHGYGIFFNFNGTPEL